MRPPARADLAIRGGRVVLEDGVVARDILVRDGTIAALAAPGEGASGEAIDARGLLVLPGVVDAHVHFNEPGRADWEGWERGTRGAAAGGVTTVLDMPLNSLPATTTVAALAAKRAAAEASALIDFGLWGGLVSADGPPLAALRDAGAVGVKAFLCDSGVPEFPPLRDLDRALAAAARADVTVALHAEDDEVVREGGA
ncbi:MAG: amidohydrolase family protein, partial [Candidatus Limnocylindria bacterium]